MQLRDLYPELVDHKRRAARDHSRASALELMQEANQLADQGRFSEAFDYYDLALTKEPDSPELWYNVGKTLSDMERYVEAVRAYDRTTELQPEFVSAWKNKGAAYAKNNKFEEARDSFVRALEIEPNNAGAREGLKIVTSILELQSIQAGKPTELSPDTTPGEYLRILQYHHRLTQHDQRQAEARRLLNNSEYLSFMAKIGQDPEKVKNAKLPDDLVRHQFDILIKGLPADVREGLEDETIFAIGELPLLTINAESTRAPNQGWVILIRQGLMVFIYKLARTICTRFVAVDEQGNTPFEEKLPEFSETCRWAKELFLNYATTGIPIGPDFPIAQPQMMMAHLLATSAEQFVVGHELAHLTLGPLDRDATKAWQSSDGAGLNIIPKTWEEEFDADRVGLNVLLMLSPNNNDKLMAYAGVELFLQMGIVFEELMGFKGSGTHPPFSERLERLRAHLMKVSSAESYEAIMQRPRTFEPLIKSIREALLNREVAEPSAGHS